MSTSRKPPPGHETVVRSGPKDPVQSPGPAPERKRSSRPRDTSPPEGHQTLPPNMASTTARQLSKLDGALSGDHPGVEATAPTSSAGSPLVHSHPSGAQRSSPAHTGPPGPSRRSTDHTALDRNDMVTPVVSVPAVGSEASTSREATVGQSKAQGLGKTLSLDSATAMELIRQTSQTAPSARVIKPSPSIARFKNPPHEVAAKSPLPETGAARRGANTLFMDLGAREAAVKAAYDERAGAKSPVSTGVPFADTPRNTQDVAAVGLAESQPSATQNTNGTSGAHRHAGRSGAAIYRRSESNPAVSSQEIAQPTSAAANTGRSARSATRKLTDAHRARIRAAFATVGEAGNVQMLLLVDTYKSRPIAGTDDLASAATKRTAHGAAHMIATQLDIIDQMPKRSELEAIWFTSARTYGLIAAVPNTSLAVVARIVRDDTRRGLVMMKLSKATDQLGSLGVDFPSVRRTSVKK